jgi:hypothetical protein
MLLPLLIVSSISAFSCPIVDFQSSSHNTAAEDPIDSSESEEESKAAPRDRTHPHTDEVARAESFNPSLHLGALV